MGGAFWRTGSSIPATSRRLSTPTSTLSRSAAQREWPGSAVAGADDQTVGLFAGQVHGRDLLVSDHGAQDAVPARGGRMFEDQNLGTGRMCCSGSGCRCGWPSSGYPSQHRVVGMEFDGPPAPAEDLDGVSERTAVMLGLGIIGWIIIGGLAGWIGSKIMHTDDQQGILLNIVGGVVGGLIGGFLLSLLGVDVKGGGLIFSFLTCLLGALILLFVLKAVTGRRHAHH